MLTFLILQWLHFALSFLYETGLYDFHKLFVTILRTSFEPLPPKIIKYRNYKNFDKDKFDCSQKDRRVVHQVTTGDNEWYNEWQWMTTSDTTSDNERPFRLILLFFRIREGSITKRPKENSLNLKEDLEEKKDIELRAEEST